MDNKKKPNIAAQLTCAALALPGLIQPAVAGRVEETYNVDFQYGNYVESSNRMKVDIYEAAFSAPIGKSMTANVSVVRDSISGASPIYNTRNPLTGEITQVKSGASGYAATSECGRSICEQRDAANAGLTTFFDWGSLNFGGGFSREHDYMSKYFNTAASLDLNKKLTTLNFGASVSFDEITPSPSPWNNSVVDNKNPNNGFNAHKTSQQYLLGVSQVINKDSLVQSNVTFGYHSGFLTDPYKWVGYTETFDFGIPGIPPIQVNSYAGEKRPRERFEFAWLTQYVRHFEQFNHAALHADYRFSTNDWGVNAHTFEMSWHQPFAEGWQIIPRFRYYSQDQADFYRPYFSGAATEIDPNSGLLVLKGLNSYSSDYRLASFGTLSGGLKITKEINQLKPFEQIKFQTGFEYYDHSASYQLGGNKLGNFADFNYYLITASFNLKF